MALAFTCNVDMGEYYYTQLFATPVVIESEDARRDDLMALITAARSAAGLAPLTMNTALTSVAQETSVYYQQQENFPNTMWDDVRAVYNFSDIEAFSFTASWTSDEIVAYWLDRRERDLLLSRALTDIGIGITFDAEQMIYVYIVFIAQPN